MKIFAIGDLHLPGGDNKPMDVFGAHWEGHFSHIAKDWLEKVGEEDLVLIPGDISWAKPGFLLTKMASLIIRRSTTQPYTGKNTLFLMLNMSIRT
ncbi:MAG: metallophosphoesterase, partial [Clostridia bacterium]|nr:metallophosphoesterase [Clostridia bacterium]